MKFTRNVAVALAALAFGAVPAVAIASGGGNSNKAPGHNKTTSSTSSTSSTSNTSSKGKAYGKYCQGASKKHVKGQKGTPFSQCVVGMAHAGKSSKMSASAACAGASKTHVKGQKGTAYSICVKGVAKMRSSTKP